MTDDAHAGAGRMSAIGASSAIFNARGEVLLIERGKAPMKGLWSLPGGHIEPGETAAETARREVREETGLDAVILGHLQSFAVPERCTGGLIVRHHGLEVFFGRARDATAPAPAGDARSARFVALADLETYPLTERCAELIRAAWARVQTLPSG